MGVRSRAFRAAIRRETDLEHAHAVIVVNADGTLTTIASDALDRSHLADALVSLAFTQVDHLRTPGRVPATP